MEHQLGQNSGKKEQPQTGAQPQLRAGKPREWYEKLMREEPRFERKREPRQEIRKKRMPKEQMEVLQEIVAGVTYVGTSALSRDMNDIIDSMHPDDFEKLAKAVITSNRPYHECGGSFFDTVVNQIEKRMRCEKFDSADCQKLIITLNCVDRNRAIKIIEIVGTNVEKLKQNDLECLVDAGLQSKYGKVIMASAEIGGRTLTKYQTNDAIFEMISARTLSWTDAITKYGKTDGFSRTRAISGILWDIAIFGLEPSQELLIYLKDIDGSSKKRMFEDMRNNKMKELKEYYTDDMHGFYGKFFGPMNVIVILSATLLTAIKFATAFEFYFDWLVGAAAGLVGGTLVSLSISETIGRILSKINAQRYVSEKKKLAKKLWGEE